MFSVGVLSYLSQREREREARVERGVCVNLATSSYLYSETIHNSVNPTTKPPNEDFLCWPRETGFDPTTYNVGFVVVKVATVVAQSFRVASILPITVMRRLTTVMRSENCVGVRTSYSVLTQT